MSEMDERFPVSEYKKTTFTLTKKEFVQASSLDTTMQIGKMAELMINNLMNQALIRCGVKTSPDVGVEYDLSTSSIHAYIPRDLCQMCKARKVTHRSKDKEGKDILLCDTCYRIAHPEVKVH